MRRGLRKATSVATSPAWAFPVACRPRSSERQAAEGAWARAREREGLEFIGKRSGDFIAPRLAELLERGLDEVFAGSDAQFEFTGRTDPDRAKRTYRTFLAPIRNEALEVVGAVGLWTDITEAKAQEQATAELQRRLSEVERAESLGRLVSGVAHELNNPLTAILNFTEELTATAEDERQRLALSVIRARSSAVTVTFGGESRKTLLVIRSIDPCRPNTSPAAKSTDSSGRPRRSARARGVVGPMESIQPRRIARTEGSSGGLPVKVVR